MYRKIFFNSRKISALLVKNLSDEEDIRSLGVPLMLNYLLICLFF